MDQHLPTTDEVRTLLRNVAQLLRHAHQLGPETQALMADLVDELADALGRPEVSSAEIARLAESASQLVRVVNEEGEAGVLDAARDRLEQAAVAVENGAPTLAGLTRRLAEMLSNIGI